MMHSILRSNGGPARRVRAALALVGVLLAGSACEGDNLFSGSGLKGRTPAEADSTGPTLEVLQPLENQTYTRGEPIRVRVHVADSIAGVRSLSLKGVTFRNFGDTLSSSIEVPKYPEIVVSFPQPPQQQVPFDTIIVRDLLPNADTASEPVWLIVSAADTLGNTSADTVFLRPGPRIDILEPTQGSQHGGTMRLHVRAIDPVVGLSSVTVQLTGSVNQTILREGLNGKRDAEVIDQMIQLPAATGTIDITATVVNRQELTVSAQPVTVTVLAQSARDSVAPQVARQLYTHRLPGSRGLRDRIELGDTLRVFVSANDGTGGSGITELGAVLVITPDSLPPQTVLRRSTFTAPYPRVIQDSFKVALKDLYQEIGPNTSFPQSFKVEVHGYALDAATGAPNCAASVQETAEARLCTANAGGGFRATGVTGQRYVTEVVAGTSLPLPANSVIADVLADTVRSRLYLSNWARNQVEVLALADSSFGPPVLVGSQPWGLFLVPGGGSPVDTLMVANSGGTSISFVPTDILREDAPRRLLTPNDVLWEVKEEIANGFIRYTVKKLEFSDRPQFVAQDRNKVILYSTEPSASAVEGTIRLALSDPTPGDPNDVVRPESKIIFGREAVKPGNDSYAIARVDSIFVVFQQGGDDNIMVCDHRPGRPQEAFCMSGYAFELLPAMSDMPNDATDIFFDRGTWDRGVVGLNDTTYVAYSKDLSTIAFGEGHAEPYGRIILYGAASTVAEGTVATQGTLDLISNAAERVLGVSLNVDGEYGVARGMEAAYFFSNDMKQEGPLRLQGLFADRITANNGGVVLHPHHGTIRDGTTDNTLAFIATSQRSIKIIDTFHFFEVGEIAVRENVVGQLRAAPPLPGVNAGLTPNHCEYTVAHLYGVSAAGAGADVADRNVLMLNVRVKHLNKDPRRAPCTR